MAQLEITVILRQAVFFSPRHHILYIVYPWHNVTLRSSINRKQYITTLSVAGICNWADTSLPHCLIHSLFDVLCLTCNDQSCRKYSCLGTTILAVFLLIPKILSLLPWWASTDYSTSYFWSYCHFFKLCGHFQLLWHLPSHCMIPPKFLFFPCRDVFLVSLGAFLLKQARDISPQILPVYSLANDS